MITRFWKNTLILSRSFTNSLSKTFSFGTGFRSFSVLRPPDGTISKPSLDLPENFSDHVRTLQKSPKPSEIAQTFWWAFHQNRVFHQSSEFLQLCDLASTVSGSFNPEELTLLFRTCIEKMTKPHIPLLHSLSESLLASRDLTPFPSVCLVNILNSLSRRQRQQKSDFVDDEKERVIFPLQIELMELMVMELAMEPRLSQLTPQELFCSVYSAGVLGLSKSNLLTPLTTRLKHRTQLEALSCKELAHLGYSLVKSKSKEFEILNKLIEVYATKAMSMSDTNELGLVLYVLGKCRTNHLTLPPTILTLLEFVDQDSVAKLRNEDISCFFHGLGKLQLKPLSVLGILSNEIQDPNRLPHLYGQQILSILVSMKDLNYQDEKLTIALSREVLFGINPVTKRQKLANFKTFELCGILHTWSRLALHKDWAIQLLVNELLKDSRRSEICPTGVGLLIHSMGLSSLYDPAILKILEATWLTTEQIKKLDDEVIFMMIDGLAKLRTVRVITLIKIVLNEFVKEHRVQNCSTLRLVGCLHALSWLFRDRKNTDWVTSLVQELNSPERISAMSERCLGLVIYSLGRLKFPQLSLMTPFVLEALKPRRLSIMDNQSISNILLGLGFMDYPDHSHVKTFAWELLRSSRRDEIHNKNYIQLTNLVLSLGTLNVESADPILQQVCTMLIKRNAIPELKTIGLKNLITNLVKLGYKQLEVYRLLIKEALARDKRGKLPRKDLSMIFESVGRLGEAELFTEMVMWGLRDLQDIEHYSMIDLVRFLAGFRSMSSTLTHPNLISRLLEEQQRRKSNKNKPKTDQMSNDDFLIT
eukprot:g6621.t1